MDNQPKNNIIVNVTSQRHLIEIFIKKSISDQQTSRWVDFELKTLVAENDLNQSSEFSLLGLRVAVWVNKTCETVPLKFHSLKIFQIFIGKSPSVSLLVSVCA